MDWFERLTGFRETSYHDTRAKLKVEDRQLHSLVNGRRYGIGELELISLHSLRERAKSAGRGGQLQVSLVSGDVRKLHQVPEHAGALFQVASQFNMLEMVSPQITPEDGVTRYEHDHTQGPACAIAAGAATIYRNYFVPVGGAHGQTKHRQLDGLAPVGEALSRALNQPVGDLWRMQNGYALGSAAGLDAIGRCLRALPPDELDALRAKLCIGIHWDVEVTDVETEPRPVVSQAFCSALPVAYTRVPRPYWEPFALLVLEAAYEATMWAGVLNAVRGASNIVLLTFLGGGAFGNDERWVHTAIRSALKLTSGYGLDVRLVSYRTASEDITEIVREFS